MDALVKGAVLADRTANGGESNCQYRVSSVLDCGQQKRVYAAWDTAAKRRVAICEFHNVDGVSQDCWQELGALAALPRHRNVIEIYKLLACDDVLYMVCELYEDGNLSQLISKGVKWPLARALALGLASGLGHIHENGFLHRDLKPSNAFVDGRHAAIGDFGMACPISGCDLQTCCEGTPAYLAPELIRGEPGSAASDVYALGCIVFEIATGRSAFADDCTVYETLRRHLNKSPPRPSALADVPCWLDDLVFALLDKDPASRPDANTVTEELEGHV
jgi:serine/threonine-protein kinase